MTFVPPRYVRNFKEYKRYLNDLGLCSEGNEVDVQRRLEGRMPTSFPARVWLEHNHENAFWSYDMHHMTKDEFFCKTKGSTNDQTSRDHRRLP